MIVVANRIPVAKGFEETFEERFRHRPGLVDKSPGFIRNEILKPLNGDYYVVLTHWESQEAFKAWMQSDAFKQAHSGGASGPPVKFAGKNVFEMHEVIVSTDKVSAVK